MESEGRPRQNCDHEKLLRGSRVGIGGFRRKRFSHSPRVWKIRDLRGSESMRHRNKKSELLSSAGRSQQRQLIDCSCDSEPDALKAATTRADTSHPGAEPMKYATFILAAWFSLFLIGCGAGHPNLTSITVSPQTASTTSNPPGQVGYTATGNFSNHTSRELSQADGLSWKTSATSTGTVAATIGSTGAATCSAPGSVTVTASAPENLQITVNNGVQNSSTMVTGTASLTCQ
jgi:hypothetical protein